MKRLVSVVLFAAAFAGSVNAAEPPRTLRVAFDDRNFGLGNPYATIVTDGVNTIVLLFDALTSIGENGALDPALATGWEAISPTRWRFSLRPGVTFSNGEPFDAAAVAATIAALKRPEAQGFYMAAEARAVERVEVVDPLTLDIVTPAPDAILPKRMSLIHIVAPKAWAELGPQKFALSPAGTGPFTVQDWGEKTGRVVMAANRASWRAPKALDRLEMFNAPEQAARTQALMSGRADFAYNIGFEDLDLVEAAGFKTVVRPVAFVNALVLQSRDPASPMHDVRVRRALNYAVDKATIATVIYRGTTQANGQGIIPGVTGYNPDIAPYPFDPDKAKRLLAEAGFADGFSVRAAYWGAGLPEVNAMYAQIAQDFARVGVKVEFNALTRAEWLELWASGDWTGPRGGFGMISGTWNGWSYNDAIRAIESYSCRKPGILFCAPELEPLIDAANAEFDPAVRERKLQDLLARYHDLAPTLYLFAQSHIYAHSPNVAGLSFRHDQVAFENMELTER